MTSIRLWSLVTMLVAVAMAGCLVEGPVDLSAAQREARAAEVVNEYNTTSDVVFALSDLPADTDWVRLELVVMEPVDRLGVTLEGLPADDGVLGATDARACVEMLYVDVGGWIGYTGEGYTFDTHAVAAPGPDAPTPNAEAEGRTWAFNAPEPLVDHVVYIAVDDAAAWLERGHDLQVRVLDEIEVHWRIAASGTADCVLHFNGYRDGSGGGARVLGTGAGTEMYRRWNVAEGSMLTVAFRADVAYEVYVAYQDRYAVAEWDSDTSLAPDGGTFFELDAPGTWGVYAPLLAGTENTYLHAFLLNR